MNGEPGKKAELDSQTIPTAYEDYIGKGGKLDSDSFHMLENFEVLDESRIDSAALKNSRDQANDMASLARVNLTDKEVDMYILLRTLPENQALVISGKRPSGLDDPDLLAEILRITDPAKHDKFVKK
jgi:hypothetical protein